MKEEVKNSDRVAVINLSKYVQPEVKLFTGKKWVLNGDNNSFYKYILFGHFLLFIIIEKSYGLSVYP